VVNAAHNSNRKTTLLSLIISAAPLEPPGTLVSLLLIEISITFGVSIGVAGQIQTFSATFSTIMALLMSVLSIKLKHKKLLQYGLLAYTTSAILCAIAPNFLLMAIAYSFVGIASAIVNPMINTLIGELLPVDERSAAIGSVNSFRAFTYLLTAPIVGYIAKIYDWRMPFLFFLFPVSLISLIAATMGVPFEGKEISENRRFLKGFTDIISNRSAVACILGSVFAQAAWFGVLAFSASFFRQRFGVGVDQASLYLSAIAGCFMMGSYLSGRVIYLFGRKRVTIYGVLFFSVLSMVYMFVSSMWMALFTVLLISLFSALRFTSSISLTLEQDPSLRGTLMSLNTAALSFGRVIGAAVGGFSLVLFGWVGVGFFMSVLGFVAACLYAFIAIDPLANEN